MSKPKQVFSIRIDPESLRILRGLARREKTTIGAIVRESLDGLLKSKEEADESSYRENRSGKCGPVDHGGVQPTDAITLISSFPAHAGVKRILGEEETMGVKIIRRREGKGERITLPVSPSTKEKWEAVVKALVEKGFEIDHDRAVQRIIRSLEGVLKEGAK